MNIYESIPLTIYCIVVAFILGSVFGSFLNCVSDRIIHHEKWWSGRSKCDACGHVLTILDLFPIFSYLFLKGKCRYCGTKLSKAYVFSEGILGLLFAFYVGIHGRLDLIALKDLGLITCLYGLSLSDLKSYEIPDGFIVFGCVWWLLFDFHISGLLSGLVIAFSILCITWIMEKILKKEAMGGGDIKLFFMVGLYLDITLSLFNLILACIIGIVFVVGMKKNKIPFGPSISLATYVSLLFGAQFVSWYLSLLGV